jgi:hypothetical protein
MDRLTKVIQLLEQAWQMEQQFLMDEPVEERERPGTFERWSRKDVIAHIETWNGRLAENIQTSLRGGTPVGYPDFDAENRKIYELHCAKTWQQVVELGAQARQRLVAAVRELGNDGLERTDILPWEEDQAIWRNIVGNGYNHAIIHIGEHYREAGDLARYAAMIEEMSHSIADLDSSPTWQGNVRYNLACAHALGGQKQRALEELCEALRLNPRLIEWSRQDSDLASLRDDPAYQALYAQ